jgi:hypothetical protein
MGQYPLVEVRVMYLDVPGLVAVDLNAGMREKFFNFNLIARDIEMMSRAGCVVRADVGVHQVAILARLGEGRNTGI